MEDISYIENFSMIIWVRELLVEDKEVEQRTEY
jgi:hypothetical protein